MKSKKGTTQLFWVGFGIIIFMTMFIATISYANDLLNTNTQNTRKSFDSFKEVLIEVSEMNSGSGKPINVQLDKETALIGFNPGADFVYFAGDKGAKAYPGSYMKHPPNPECATTDACLCTCEGLKFSTPEDTFIKKVQVSQAPTQAGTAISVITYEVNPNAKTCFREKCEITCEYMKCASLEGIKFPEKSMMLNVFDDDKNRVPLRTDHYWDNSIILLRSQEINPAASLGARPYVLAGYQDFYPTKYTEVFIKKESGTTQSVLSICMKEDCSSKIANTQCSYNSCTQIKDKQTCVDSSKITGCSLLKCEWLNDVDGCVQHHIS